MQQAFYTLDGNAGKSAATQGDLRNYPITGYVLKNTFIPMARGVELMGCLKQIIPHHTLCRYSLNVR